MRIVIPSGYVMLVEHHVRDPYHDFDIQEIDTPCVREAILWHMGRLLRGFRYELHTHWKEVYYDEASQSRSRLTVMHYGGSKLFAQYQYELVKRRHAETERRHQKEIADLRWANAELSSQLQAFGAKFDELYRRMPSPPTFNVPADAYD
ncbi:hypothetical protein COCNU_16G000460 [Cocos nucifera]|uniref:Uncharacterized protein n=1 Tax=Cocos nucifera TaxID=13894 RepID=A0A8K0IXW6_COCNU|nr:hypothetical protein COCNU_16G000460 [Cocos nucifera]